MKATAEDIVGGYSRFKIALDEVLQSFLGAMKTLFEGIHHHCFNAFQIRKRVV